MVRLLSLLAAAMFLVLLIGGRDHGQARFGLAGHYAPEAYADLPPARPAPAAVPAARAPEPAPGRLAASLTPASFTPATPPAATPPAAAPAATAPTADPLPLRYVSANAVNVRQGPSTTEPVIGRLTRNEAVTVVENPENGWVLIKIEGDGIQGYVAERLLSKPQP
ncbi:MAG: SH3 domain-containing protein [Paracoccaceae bacterium]|nr:MAG: SH3 domain-containing protein [Paracoccaceae bacterium]QYK41528.1 MAG: SH3 domain-containing protein [Paracoccaceae bacterium]